MRTLDDEALELLEAARVVAQEHRHVEIDPEHVLVAALATDRYARVFAVHGFDFRAMREAVGVVLGQKALAPSYRDAAPPVESEQLRDFVAAARTPAGLFDHFSPVSAETMIGVLATRREIIWVGLHAPRAIKDSYDALILARAAAYARGHTHISFRHLARVLADDVAVFVACEEDPKAADALADIRTRLEDVLALGPSKEIEPEVDPALRAFLTAGPLDKDTYAPRLFVAVLAHDHVRDLFQVELPAVPVTVPVVLAIARFTGDLMETEEDLLPNEVIVDVVVHDSDATTMEFVVDVLTECFGLSPTAAKERMLTVHTAGRATVGSFPAHEAKHRTGIARGRARAIGTPLRISLVEASLR